MAPLFPRSGPGESGSPTSQVILRCYDFPARIPGHLFVSLPGSTLPSSVRVSQLALTLPEGRRGAFRARVNVQPATRLPACSHVDVSGTSQVSRRSILCLCLGPGPRPNQRSLAYLSVSSMLPPLRRQRRLQRVSYFGAIARLQHLLPTLQEWCCHHPCKARFRLAGLPLPGGSRTLWIALKGFRSHFHSPFLDFSWRYCDELPPLHWITSSAVANSVSGMVRPSALAVLRLMISSTLVGCSTGRPAGFSPLRMRPV